MLSLCYHIMTRNRQNVHHWRAQCANKVCHIEQHGDASSSRCCRKPCQKVAAISEASPASGGELLSAVYQFQVADPGGRHGASAAVRDILSGSCAERGLLDCGQRPPWEGPPAHYGRHNLPRAGRQLAQTYLRGAPARSSGRALYIHTYIARPHSASPGQSVNLARAANLTRPPAVM